MTLQFFPLCSFKFRYREPVIKVENFFEETVPNMPPRIFRRYFRMYPATLYSIFNYFATSPILYQREQYIRIPKIKKIAMTCAYLGCSLPLLQ